MKDKKVIFMGTPSFSVPVLEALYENTNVIAVVTQPDKEVGRKKVLTKSPVKEFAISHDIKVLQPIKLREDYKSIIDLKPDVIVTCAYGQILPEELIYAPTYNTVNVHASLLPKLRGGAPIHHAILNDYDKTGITIMYTDKGMDSGDIITEESIDIDFNDTYDTLSAKLSKLGAELLIKTLPSVFNNVKGTKQESSEVTYAYTIKREDEHIDFNRPTKEVYNKIRALSSMPGAYAILDGQEVKIFASRIGIGTSNKNKTPGDVVEIYKDGIGLATKDGEIIITSIKISGKKQMNVRDYLNGVNKEELKTKKFI